MYDSDKSSVYEPCDVCGISTHRSHMLRHKESLFCRCTALRKQLHAQGLCTLSCTDHHDTPWLNEALLCRALERGAERVAAALSTSPRLLVFYSATGYRAPKRGTPQHVTDQLWMPLDLCRAVVRVRGARGSYQVVKRLTVAWALDEEARRVIHGIQGLCGRGRMVLEGMPEGLMEAEAPSGGVQEMQTLIDFLQLWWAENEEKLHAAEQA